MRFSVNKFLFSFLIIVFIELMLGGGGRILELGNLTLRMYLFFIGLIVALLYLQYKRKIDKEVVFFVIASIVFLIYPIILGLINGASLNLIFLDIKPLIFTFFVLIAHVSINNTKQIEVIGNVIRIVTLLMAIVYLSILYLLLSGKINFISFYKFVTPYNEFFFRGSQGFFTYKGFIYMGVGLFFWLFSYPNLKKNIAILIIIVAIIFTGTRGFLVALAIIFFISIVLPKIAKGNLLYLIFTILPLFLAVWFLGSTELGDKIQSDSVRITQFFEVLERINFFTLFFGHGFGIGVPIREMHMEIAYLEIFHKQGLIGLAYYSILFTFIYLKYRKITIYKKLVRPFFLSAIYVAILSFTNPYINNPIGLSMVLITFVVINKVHNIEKEKNISLLSKL
ncbi:hypothetical protein C9994_05715 [Marivirga lumbricoides]|uniref:O-antigen ligase domain-containing protein n=1 Tax=Marivirga lumbricoides TaxID=1046115 RepID=A0A2T4DSJ1_9BACT|nr:hypothetical protein C9994_05715 [Marivirga lumbricoides]